jgi:hypothetical protein
MKKIIFVFALKLTALIGYAQEIFPTQNAVWVNGNYELMEAGAPSPFPVLVGTFSYCMTSSDTVINNVSYHTILYCSDETYKGATRNNGDRVYFVPADSTQEFLLYDFNVDKGDTILEVYIEYGGRDGMLADLVVEQDTDSVLIDGRYRRIVSVSGSYWIEGIGCSNGLFEDPYIKTGDYWTSLYCMSHFNTQLYPEEGDGACEVIDNLSENRKDLNVKVYPNPIDDGFLHVEININLGNTQLTLTNSLGQTITPKINTTNVGAIIHVADLLPGIYFLTIKPNQGVVVKKVLIE